MGEPARKLPPLPANDTTPEPRREWVLLPFEAKERGFKNALAFRRWCVRHTVTIRKDGKMQWVKPADVDAAIAGAPVATDSIEAAAEAALTAAGN